MRTTPLSLLLPILGLSCLLAGCTPGASAPARHWALPPAPVAAGAAAEAGAPVLVLARPSLPATIARRELVVRDGPRMRVLSGDRWVAPPGSLFQEALALRLAARLPDHHVLAWPAARPGRSVAVAFERLDGPAAGPLVLVATVSVEGAPPRRVRRQAPITGRGIEARLEAHGALLDGLVDDIAEVVREKDRS